MGWLAAGLTVAVLAVGSATALAAALAGVLGGSLRALVLKLHSARSSAASYSRDLRQSRSRSDSSEQRTRSQRQNCRRSRPGLVVGSVAVFEQASRGLVVGSVAVFEQASRGSPRNLARRRQGRCRQEGDT